MELASLNLLNNFREAETEPELVEGEFPRALKLFSLVTTANGILNQKI